MVNTNDISSNLKESLITKSVVTSNNKESIGEMLNKNINTNIFTRVKIAFTKMYKI